jgi:3-hydroxyisobutyrate dehydrogenase-like beta-hydroxyacid dehydrogenase
VPHGENVKDDGMNVGFLGLGSMGSAMAANILKAGNALTVWNRSPGKTEELAKAGAEVASSPTDLAACDVVFAMLANDQATRETVSGSGLPTALPKNAIIVNCGTISIELAAELTAACTAAGVGYVAAPVLGRPNVAAEGKLNVIAAGNADVVARVQPLLDAIGQKTWYVGSEPVQANVAKIGANFLIASAIGAMGEAFAIAEGNGLDPRELYEIITNTLFAAPVYKGYGAQILEKRYEPAGFQLKLGRKDVGLAQSAGASGKVSLPLADALAKVFEAAIAAGDGEKDWSAIALQTAQKALSGA